MMERRLGTFAIVAIFHLILLFGTGESIFPFFKKGLLRPGLVRSVLTPRCSASMKQYPSLKDLADFRYCLKPVPWVNGNRRHQDQDLRVNQVISKYGYDLVTYNNVTTSDGYILSVFRITGPRPQESGRSGKPVVVLLHGLGTAADEWVLQSDVRKNLPMKLADEGYEVWLANARGTDVSRGHTSMQANTDIKYWNFSFHEIGVFDLVAVIDLALAETGNSKVFFIGHNQGATAYAAAVAEHPELNDKIEAAVMLGPSMFLGHTNSPLRFLFRSATEISPVVQEQINTAMRGTLAFSNWRLNPTLAKLCTPTAIKCGVCGNLLFFLYGFDAPQINFNDIPNIMSKAPNTMSFKTALHMGQSIKSCDFRKYDYGRFNNIRFYGQDDPPQYNLTNLRAPLYIYFGNGDNLATLEDIVMTKSSLPEGTLKEVHRVEWKLFNNADFMIAKDAETLVYNRVLENFKEYATKYKTAKNKVSSPTEKPFPIKTFPKPIPISVHIYGNGIASNGTEGTL